MSSVTQSAENQTPVNGYILRAMSRIIVPKGMDEVEVLVGDQKVTVKSSKDEVSGQTEQDPNTVYGEDD